MNCTTQVPRAEADLCVMRYLVEGGFCVACSHTAAFLEKMLAVPSGIEYGYGVLRTPLPLELIRDEQKLDGWVTKT